MSTNSKTEINKFGIVVIESLKEGELQTGTKLYNDVLRPRCAAEESMFCEYYRVHSVSDGHQWHVWSGNRGIRRILPTFTRPGGIWV